MAIILKVSKTFKRKGSQFKRLDQKMVEPSRTRVESNWGSYKSWRLTKSQGIFYSHRTLIHGKLLTYKANGFRIKREMKLCIISIIWKMLILGGYTGKWLRKHHMVGGIKKTGFGSQPGRPRFQFFISYWTLYDWTGFLDGALSCSSSK